MEKLLPYISHDARVINILSAIIKHDKIENIIHDTIAKTVMTTSITKYGNIGTGGSNYAIYIWDNVHSLWSKSDVQELKSLIDQIISNMRVTINTLNFIIFNDDVVPEVTKLKSKLYKMMNDLKRIPYRNSVCTMFQQLVMEEFAVPNDDIEMFPVADNKIINVRTGEIRERIPSDFFTFSSKIKYDLNARSDKFDKYIADITLNNKEVERTLQIALGACLSGKVTGKIYVLHGIGNNGISTLLSLMKNLLHNFSSTVPFNFLHDTLRNSVGDTIRWINCIKSARMLILGDFEGDLSYNRVMSLVHDVQFHTGVDNEYFTPRCKVLLTTRVPLIDNKLRNRIVNIPFNAVFTNNPVLPHERLRELGVVNYYSDSEFMSSMLNWLLGVKISPDASGE